VKTIHISKIIIPQNRQRTIFNEGDILKLSTSIQNVGVLHPVVVRPDAAGDYCLVAGERRLRAMADLHSLAIPFRHDGAVVAADEIPYTLINELDPLAYEEAELEENTHRVDLSWQERTVAVNRLAALRAKQADVRGEAPPTVADIAREVRGSTEGVHYQTTRREILLASHLGNPLIAGAKTVDEAFKILVKEEQKEKSKQLGITVGKSFTGASHTALHASSLGWMRECEEGKFDVILTDPPYGMGADGFGDAGKGSEMSTHAYSDDWETALDCYTTLAVEGMRITKAQAHLYAFCHVNNFQTIKEIFQLAGWLVFETPLIWYKKTGFRAPWPELGPQRKYEAILYAIKGKRPTLQVRGDVLEFGQAVNSGHPAQKPVELYADLLARSCNPGDTVLDPFMGSGTIFEAAHGMKVSATGIELDQTYYGIALARLQKLY